MGQCAFDLDELRHDLDDDWLSFVAYNLAMATSETAGAAGRLLRKAGPPRIPADELDRIAVPTTLIRGCHDRPTGCESPSGPAPATVGRCT